jgi:hypothetical protein
MLTPEKFEAFTNENVIALGRIALNNLVEAA